MNLLGIDFEEWYHPELIQKHYPTLDKKLSVVRGIDKILDWLRKNDTSATFFTVGELLERKPELLDRIIEEGHEIAFHTMYHTRLDSPNYKDMFTDEVRKFNQITGGRSIGFRAPSFSLNPLTSWAIDILSENNYLYDSSIVPVKTRLYGIPDAERKPYKISSTVLNRNTPDGKLMEFPLLTTKFFGKLIPAAGGFYLRVLPLKIIENAINNCNKELLPATFYIHSWELTPEYMPDVSLPFFDKFITYYNLKSAFTKMDKLIKKFKFTSFKNFLKLDRY